MTATALAPTWSSVPDWHFTLGPDVAELCDRANYTPDANQAAILDATFAYTRDKRPAAFEVVVVAPRQNLKTGVEKQIALGKFFLLEKRLVVFSAHESSTVHESFIDLKALIEASPFLDRQVKRIYEAEGREFILTHDGRRMVFRSRTGSGGRGLTGDDVILDEGFALRAMHMGALLPIMLTKPEAQLVTGSSAGLAQSEVLRGQRDRGRAGIDPRLAYFEWGDEHPHEGCASEECDHAVTREGCALDDRSRWWATNPTLGDRIDEESIADLRRSLPPEEFARECLGWWDEPGAVHAELTVQAWDALAGDVAPKDPLVLWLDVAPGQASASVGVTDGVECELIDRRVGAAWLVDRVVEVQAKHGCRAVAFDGASSAPVAALVPDLLAAGLPLAPVAGGDWARACQAMVRLVKQAAFRHDGSPEFAAAVAGARWRVVGDGLKLSRRDSTVDITPLAGLTAGLWVATSEPAPSEGFALVIPTT